MKTHPPFELPPCSFTWSVKWGRVAMYCILDDRAMKLAFTQALFMWMSAMAWSPVQDMVPQAGMATLSDVESLDLGNPCTE